MFKFFWIRSASIWLAILYILLGLLLLLFPAASGTVFVWLLAFGAGVYALVHLWRYIQFRRTGVSMPGDLFLTVLPLAFTVFALLWPQAILSILPLVLGSLLLVDGVGKIPLAYSAAKVRSKNLVPLLFSSLLPLLLGILIVVNPFQTARIAIMIFGASLIADGIADLVAYIYARRYSE